MNIQSLRLAFRQIRRHKSSFFINLIGLSSGLACALLIFLWVFDEWKTDKFHENAEVLFQVMENQEYDEGLMTTMSTPGLLAETLKEEIPEIDRSATVTWNQEQTFSFGEKNIKAEGHYVGSDFLSMFTYPLLQGDPGKALTDMYSLVLSRSLAESLFGSVEEAMGQGVEVDHEDMYTVTGVVEDPPGYSSYDFQFLMNYEKFKSDREWLTSWGNNAPRTMVTLVPGADPATVSDKIAGFVAERNEDSNVTLFLQPYTDRYLFGRFENGVQSGGRIEYVRLFSIIALFILLIACINFMNLSTARASLRAKEIGVKKTVGAVRANLIRQFLTESTLIALISLGIALGLVYLVLPHFNLITDKEIAFRFSPGMVASFLGLALLTGLMAGSYPALYLSSFRPVTVLKGELRSSLGELWARRGLVIFQFTLSVILIVAVFVVYRQIQYAQNKNLGYAKDQLVYFSKVGKLLEDPDPFLLEARQLPGIANISAIGHNLIGRQNNTSGLEWEGKSPDERILFENVAVTYDLLETIQVEMAEGRFYSRDYGSDSTKIIFNETGIEVMGLEDPIGKQIRLWDEYDLEIIGVVKDFHFQSMHENVKPLFFRLNPENSWNVMARLEAGRETEALAALKGLYERYNPGFPFDYNFLNEEYAQQYAAERRVATLSRYFAGFAILISCLGLFGLAAFTADRKRKEIGIRKVLGASSGQIVLLLTRDFTRLVLVSLAVGLPVAWWLTGNWLERFAYRIELNPLVFFLAGILVLVIAWLTVSTQALRSAQLNPTDCLRDE